ncbi:peptidylprolyl isomerase [Magnetovibrio sp.]|uniref:peptidylprolyl isomerase n=1 Tax=Magnetovibrio sp. TaxID=2024836 RepID=UPI002F95D86E
MAFLIVNGEKVELKDALHWSSVSDAHPFLEATVERTVLHQYAHKQGHSVTAEEVQAESDRTRFAMGLSDPDETKHWLKRQRLTTEEFAAACAHAVLRNKVRASISDQALENHYAENPDQFTEVDIYIIRQRNAKKLHQLSERLRDGKANFHLEAISQSEDPETALHGGYLGRMRRDEVPEELAIAVFSVDAGDIIGPIADQDGSLLILVKGWRLLPFDDVRDEIRDIVFGELISDLTKVAVISLPS